MGHMILPYLHNIFNIIRMNNECFQKENVTTGHLCVCFDSGLKLTFHHSSVITCTALWVQNVLIFSGFIIYLPFFSLTSLSLFLVPCFFLHRFDIYRKVPKDLTQPTYTGAFSK